MKIITFGEIIWDIYDGDCTLGGAGLNFAAHCKKCGLDSILISAVGNDELGKSAMEKIKSIGINSDIIKTNEKITGRAEVVLDQNAVPTFEVKNDVAYDSIHLTDSDLVKIKEYDADAIMFGTLIQKGELSRRTLKRLISSVDFKQVVCDVNLRKGCYDRESVLFCLENATVLKVSSEEEGAMRNTVGYRPADESAESICRAITEGHKNIAYVLFTMGEKGSYVYDRKNENGIYVPPKNVQVVSTVGAGDSFTAAFVSSFLFGCSLSDAAKFATELSAYIVSIKGAIGDYSPEQFLSFPNR